jgi:hypothetical protein
MGAEVSITEQDVLEAQVKALGIKTPTPRTDLYAACVEFCKAKGRAPMTDDLLNILDIPETTFRRNTIANNDVALQMFSNADENVFTENNFINNLSPLQLIGRSTTTSWSQNGRGNFWSEYDGYDLNENGLGDVPLKIQNVFQYMEGNYPHLRIYLDSPAARALAAAEKTFPILRASSEVDAAPLMKAVVLAYPLEEERSTKRIHTGLMMASLLLLTAGATVIWKGQRFRQQ